MYGNGVFVYLIALLISSGCSNKTKFHLEQQTDLIFKEASYNEWISGVQGGGSGFQFFFEIENYNAIKDKTQILGVYFRNEYVELEFQSPNKFQGFVETSMNSKNRISPEGPLNKELKEGKESKHDEQKIDIPFDLKADEAVISYKYKNEILYYKMVLTLKEDLDIPR